MFKRDPLYSLIIAINIASYILYKHSILLPFMKAPKREKRGFSFWCFFYILTFANINIRNKKPHGEPEEL